MSKDSVRYGRMPRRCSSPDPASTGASNGSYQRPTSSLGSPPQLATQQSQQQQQLVPALPTAADLSSVILAACRAPPTLEFKPFYQMVVNIAKLHYQHCLFSDLRMKDVQRVEFNLVSVTHPHPTSPPPLFLDSLTVILQGLFVCEEYV